MIQDTMIQDAMIQAAPSDTRAQASPRSGKAMTLAAFFDDLYYPDACLRKKRPQLDRSIFDHHIRPSLGHHALGELDGYRLDAWVQGHIRKRYAPRTINKHIFLMNRLLNMARHWGLIPFNSFENRRLRRLPIGDFSQRFLTHEEIARLLAACDADSSPHIREFARLLLLTGARYGEALGMVWRDIDRPMRLWRVPRAKGGRSRHIVLGSAALDTLDDVRDCNRRLGLPTGLQDPVFVSPVTGTHYRHFHSAWIRCRKRAGLTDVRLHDLRHTYASILINSGATLHEVQRLMGHHNIAVTERYAHLLPSTLHARVEGIAPFMNGAA